MKLIVAFRNYAKTPNNCILGDGAPCIQYCIISLSVQGISDIPSVYIYYIFGTFIY
jgi:hypothetical protein